MESENLAAVIDLLGPAEFEAFKAEIRKELRQELLNAERENQALRHSLSKLETHIRRILLYYKIPIDKSVALPTDPPVIAPHITELVQPGKRPRRRKQKTPRRRKQKTPRRRKQKTA